MVHESDDTARESAIALRAPGAPARRLLAQCIEHQQVLRAQLSRAARALGNAGFVRIEGPVFEGTEPYLLCPTLAGEEALDILEADDEPSLQVS